MLSTVDGFVLDTWWWSWSIITTLSVSKSLSLGLVYSSMAKYNLYLCFGMTSSNDPSLSIIWQQSSDLYRGVGVEDYLDSKIDCCIPMCMESTFIMFTVCKLICGIPEANLYWSGGGGDGGSETNGILVNKYSTTPHRIEWLLPMAWCSWCQYHTTVM